ncbi:MAG TPA: MBL fold metallo-hydrolase [Deltaproteobacteria bacterium]|nr:MBL fold metallo-hydrolase [Deltaproteobacteria bacterium]
MKIMHPGTIAGNLSMIGNIMFPSYLIGGKTPCMFDAGVSAMGPLYLGDIIPLLADGGLKHLFFTHSHYDHTGAWGYLSRFFPEIITYAHPLVSEVMRSPRALATMTRLSSLFAGLFHEHTDHTEFLPPRIDRDLKDGDLICLDEGIEIHVLETPGHTRDSLSYFLEPYRAVVPGEALGVIHPNGEVFPEFLNDYEAYISSALKIMALGPEMILMPHGYALTGEDAEAFLNEVIPATHRFHDMITDTLEHSGGDSDQATAMLFEQLYDEDGIGQERTAFLVNLEAKVRCVKKTLDTR